MNLHPSPSPTFGELKMEHHQHHYAHHHPHASPTSEDFGVAVHHHLLPPPPPPHHHHHHHPHAAAIVYPHQHQQHPQASSPWAQLGTHHGGHFEDFKHHDFVDHHREPRPEDDDDERRSNNDEQQHGDPSGRATPTGVADHILTAPSTTTTAPSTSSAPTTASTTTGGRKPRKTKKETFTCPEVHCGKTFPRSFALRRHMRIHTGTKPYICDFAGCTQRFNTSGNLSRHRRIHSGERPYPCVFASCGKRFNTSTKLKRHMRIHFPDGQNVFQCVQSGCAFACDNYKEYVHHQRQHGNPAFADHDDPAAEDDDDEMLVDGAADHDDDDRHSPRPPAHHHHHHPHGIMQDENVDRSNVLVRQPKPQAKRSGAGGRTKARAGTKANAAVPPEHTEPLHPAPLPPRTSFAMGGHQPHHQYAHSSSSSSPGYMGLAASEIPERRLFGGPPTKDPPPMLRDAEIDYALDHRRPLLKGLGAPDEQRPPRLPFPTEAFPTESIAASPMNAGSFASTFHPLHSGGGNPTSTSGQHHHHHPHHQPHHPQQPTRYYDPVSSFAPSSSAPVYHSTTVPSYAYLARGEDPASSGPYGQPSGLPPPPPPHYDGPPYSSSSSSPPPPPSGGLLRPSHGMGAGISTASATTATTSASDDAKYPPPHQHHQHQQQQHYGTAAVGPEFTGEELSAVLELMKDS